MIEAGVLGVGLLGPGFADWAGGAPLLADPSRWQRSPTVVPAPARLPANERRRAGTVVKAALAVADQAVAMAGADPHELATVFTSSTGDPANCHALCEALAQPERLVSPTRFTNSVHNAPAGYWHIATATRTASTSIAAFDASFGAGLLEALVQVTTHRRPVLLVASDVPYPEPLATLRPVADTMAVALVLAPRDVRSAWRLAVRAGGRGEVTPAHDTALEALRGSIPAARALPLLAALAGSAASVVAIEAVDGLTINVSVSR